MEYRGIEKLVMNMQKPEETVQYRGRPIKFDDLASVQAVLLNKCEKLMKTSLPFKTNNLTGERIFDDCWQYL